MNNLDNIVYDSPELKFEMDFWNAMRGRGNVSTTS